MTRTVAMQEISIRGFDNLYGMPQKANYQRVSSSPNHVDWQFAELAPRGSGCGMRSEEWEWEKWRRLLIVRCKAWSILSKSVNYAVIMFCYSRLQYEDVFFSYLGNFESHLNIFPHEPPTYQLYAFLHRLASMFFLNLWVMNRWSTPSQRPDGLTGEQLQAPRCSYTLCWRVSMVKWTRESMMYVAGATKHRNRAICISLINAHNWDHIRPFFLFEGISRIGGSFPSHKAFSDPASWVRRLRSSSNPRSRLSDAKR